MKGIKNLLFIIVLISFLALTELKSLGKSKIENKSKIQIEKMIKSRVKSAINLTERNSINTKNKFLYEPIVNILNSIFSRW